MSLAALALALASPGTGPEGPPQPPLAERFAALLAPESEGGAGTRGDALVALGPEARVLLIGALPGDPWNGALRHAVRGFGREALARWWPEPLPADPAPAASAAPPTPPGAAEAAQARPRRADPAAELVLLAELGDPDDLGLALERSTLRPRLAVEAAAAILARGAVSPPSLTPLTLGLPPEQATCLVRAVGSLESDEGLAWLGELLGFGRAELELPLLSAIESAARLAVADEETRREVRERLWSDDEQVLRKAASAATLLQDDEAIERLVGLLEHPTAFVRSSALRALRVTSGRSLPDDPELWSRWLAVESAWFEQRGPLVLGALQRSHREEIIAATRELAERRLHRRAIARELAGLLGHTDVRVRRAACEALGHLGLREAAAELAPLLEDEEPAVARAAHRALGELGRPLVPPATVAVRDR